MTNTPAETVERLQWPPSEEQLNEWLAQIVEVFWSASSANFIRAGKLRVEDIKAKYALREIIRPFVALTAAAPSASVAGEAMREACAQAAYRWWDGEPEDAEDLRATIRAVPLAALPSKPDGVTMPEEWGDDREYQRGKDDGATFVLEALADMIGAKDWHIADGSEEWEGDVRGTAYNILVAGGVVDEENGFVARHLRPGHARCPTCNGDFDQAEWDADNRCPECETPKPDAVTVPEKLGRFGHHPDARTDYECEIDALIGMAYERLTMGGQPDLEERIWKAMDFRTTSTPGELRWLNQVFRGKREIYAVKPAWVHWPEDRLAAYTPKPDAPDRVTEGERAFPEAADGTPTIPGEVELWAAGCDLETAKFVARMLIQQGHCIAPAGNIPASLEEVAQEIRDSLDLLDNVTATDSTADDLGCAELALQRVLAALTTPARLLEENEALRTALEALLDRYVGLVASGDAGFWDAEKEPEVIAARAALGGETR